MNTAAGVDAPPRPPSRAAAALDRLPAWLIGTGRCVDLTARVLVAAVTAPYSYGAEFIEEFRFAVKRAWLAMIITSFAFAFGPAGVQGAGFLELFGALDRLGGLYSIFIVREFAPLVVAIIVAGVIGTTVTADLGARKIREELDALSVLGIDTVRSIVVPRFLVIVALGPLFLIFAIIAGTAGAAVVELQNSAPLGPFLAGFWDTANTTELLGAYVKTTLFCVVIAAVSCYKGLTVTGGAEGVGRAVNETVVISFLTIGAVDYLYGQLLLASVPGLSEIR